MGKGRKMRAGPYKKREVAGCEVVLSTRDACLECGNKRTGVQSLHFCAGEAG